MENKIQCYFLFGNGLSFINNGHFRRKIKVNVIKSINIKQEMKKTLKYNVTKNKKY